MKGYLVSCKYDTMKRRLRLKKNLSFLTNMQTKVKSDVQIFIAYHWRKKLARIKQAKIKEQIRLEKEASGCFAYSNDSDRDTNYDGISNARGFQGETGTYSGEPSEQNEQ